MLGIFIFSVRKTEANDLSALSLKVDNSALKVKKQSSKHCGLDFVIDLKGDDNNETSKVKQKINGAHAHFLSNNLVYGQSPSCAFNLLLNTTLNKKSIRMCLDFPETPIHLAICCFRV
jgi:hypothetical protein